MHTFSTHPPLYLQNKQICKYTTLSTHLSLSILMIACCLMSFSRSCGRMHACHMRRRIHADDCMLSHVIWGGGYMLSDVIWGGGYILMIACCLMSFSRSCAALSSFHVSKGGGYMHVIWGGGYMPVSPFLPSTWPPNAPSPASYVLVSLCFI